MTGIIIQARQGSKRLPKKMSLKFYDDFSILEIIIKRVKKAFPRVKVVLATTTKEADLELCLVAEKYEVDVFRGSENDVLDRFTQAAKYYGINKIIRVCADNPFLDMYSLGQLISKFEVDDFDYMSFETHQKTPVIKTHYGFWAEAVALEVLENIKSSVKDNYYREHVTNYIYEHSDKYKIKFLSIPEFIIQDDIRLTIDTEKDFETAQAVYEEVVTKNGFTIKEIYNLVISKKEWLETMSNQINEQKK